MTLNREELQKFVEKIAEFDSLSHTERTICFGYYLQTLEQLDQFCPSQIQECYHALDIPTPKNIADIMGKAKDKKRLIQRQGGYRVSNAESERLRKLVDQSEVYGERFEKVYKPGQIYEFYKDVKLITSLAKTEVFIIDAYANEDIINLYLDQLQVGIKILILTNKPQGNFINIAQKFKLKHNSNFIVKANDKCHDRLFFVDKKCHVVGQSIDKAATDKPTYLIRIADGGIFRRVFQTLFDTGKTLV